MPTKIKSDDEPEVDAQAADEPDVPDDETPDQAKARRFAAATTDAKAKAAEQAQADETKVDAREAEADEAPEVVQLADSPDYRFATEADPPPSDPAHPAHDVWHEEYAGGPSREAFEAIKAEQAEAAEAEAATQAVAAEAAETEEAFDPGEHTVDEVKEYVDAHPGELAVVVAAERAGKDRSSITGLQAP